MATGLSVQSLVVARERENRPPGRDGLSVEWKAELMSNADPDGNRRTLTSDVVCRIEPLRYIIKDECSARTQSRVSARAECSAVGALHGCTIWVGFSAVDALSV